MQPHALPSRAYLGDDMNVDQIFDAIGKASAYVIACDQRAGKRKQLSDVLARRCGNCYHWMKSSCRPEKEHGQFKSSNSCACKDFERDDGHGLIQKFENELKLLDEKVASFK